MSARKRLRLLLLGPSSLPLIEEEESGCGGGGPDPKRVRATELNTCLNAIATALGDPNRALLRRVFFVAEDKSKYVCGLLS